MTQFEKISGNLVQTEGEFKRYIAHVQFNDLSGRSFTFLENTDTTKYSVGEQLTVYYPKGEPENAVLRRTMLKNLWGGMHFLLMGLFFNFASFITKMVEDEEKTTRNTAKS